MIRTTVPKGERNAVHQKRGIGEGLSLPISMLVKSHIFQAWA
jgi:hypothetical protein